MKKILILLALGVVAICVKAQSAPRDTIIDLEGYRVYATLDGDTLRAVALNLFRDEVKTVANKGLTERIEESLWAQIQGVDEPSAKRAVLKSGTYEDLKAINPEITPAIGNFDGKMFSAAWNVDGKYIVVMLPVSYEAVYRGNRAEIENQFIHRVKNADVKALKLYEVVDTNALQPYGDELNVLPGGWYQNKKITRDAYFTAEIDTVTGAVSIAPVHDVRYPVESIANMFVCPTEDVVDRHIVLRVLKHEYGDNEDVETTVGSLLAVCAEEGAIPYWGFEKYEDGQLQGAVIVPNASLGYTHVLTVMCNPLEVIEKGAPIKARTSLYVPVNNIDNLFGPDVKIVNPERPKYEIHVD